MEKVGQGHFMQVSSKIHPICKFGTCSTYTLLNIGILNKITQAEKVHVGQMLHPMHGSISK